MITYVVCNLLESPAQVLVNTVNTVGVMGKGIAKEFKAAYPEMFSSYQTLCERKLFSVGQLWLHKTPNKWVLNFPTKKNWRHPSRPEYIEEGLQKFATTYHQYRIVSASFPLLGCGNGELDWETQVRPLMERYLADLPITIYIHLREHDPFTPEHRDIKAMKAWLHREPESLSFQEVWDDIQELLREPLNLVSVSEHKPFVASLGPEGVGLEISTEESSLYMPEETLMDLWQQLRDSGFMSPQNMPLATDEDADFMVPFLANLPYVKPVKMTDSYEKTTSFSVGLRLAPRVTAPRQPPLFSSKAS